MTKELFPTFGYLLGSSHILLLQDIESGIVAAGLTVFVLFIIVLLQYLIHKDLYC